MFEGVTPEDINDKNLLDINYGLEINQTTFWMANKAVFLHS